jgi:hypothetical protein
MSKGKSIPAPAVIPAEKKYTQQQFIDAYQELCKKTGWQIVGQPGLKPMQDLGGALIVVQLAVIPFEPPK